MAQNTSNQDDHASILTSTIRYRIGGVEQIDVTEPLWHKQKAYHLKIDTINPECFDGIEFNTRMQQLKDKAEELITVLAEDPETEQVIAYCLATINAVKLGEVDSVYVEDLYRGQGIGTELMRIALNWMEENKASKTKIHVLEVNQQALKLYRTLGFKVRQLELIRNNNSESSENESH